MHQLENERNRKDSEILKLTTRINELELQLSMKDQDQVQQSIVSSGADGKDSIKLKWREGKKAPCKISNSYVGLMAAAVDGDTVYVMENAKIYAYNASINAWSQLPNSKFEGCALAIVNNLLTLIGGWNLSNATSTLLSLTRRWEFTHWTEEFPPMPTSRRGACALCTETTLIVAGGSGSGGAIATTELFNIATLQWSSAIDLPQPTYGGSLLHIKSDTLYMLGAYDKENSPIKSVYICSLNALLQSNNPQSLRARLARSLSPSKVWRIVADIPAVDSAYVSLHGQLLAVGGNYTLTTAVHMYNPSSSSWEVISHIAIPRRKCYAAVLPDYQLIVVGGTIDYGHKLDAVEIATSL